MEVEAIFRYPVKSMAGESLQAAQIGWHGVDGDRRFALRRLEDPGGFPWLSASKLAELVTFTPLVRDGLCTHVRTPDGRELPVRGAELAAEIARLHGHPVEMMRLDRGGIFDEGTISVITPATVAAIAPDVRRFRPNLLVRTDAPSAFEEDAWVGGVLWFDDDGPELAITRRDERCAMLNLDPDTARSDPQIMKTVVRLNDNHAGVYASVIRPGRVAVGQRVHIRHDSRSR